MTANIEKIRDNLKSILGWRELRSGQEVPIERIEDISRETLRLFDKEVGREAVAWSLAWPREAKEGKVNAMTTFHSKERAEEYSCGCLDGDHIQVVPLYTSPLAREDNTQWLPIHTAPHDGSHVIVCKIGLTHDVKGYDPRSDEWKEIIFNEKPIIRSVWWVSSARFEKGKWRWACETLCDPTHWMPLPAKPRARGSEPNTEEQKDD